MQAPFTVPAIYSGKKGSVAVSSVRGVVEWTPSVNPAATESGSAGATVVIRLDDIAGLQASPATHAKIRLRITTTSQAQFVFELQSRPNLESLKSVLANSASAAAADPVTDRLKKLPAPQNALSDADLLADTALQQSLLKSNADLQQQFLDAVVAQRLPSDEFWRTRVPMLRMYSLVQAQRRGPYNVLATIKPVSTTQSDTTGSGVGAPQVKVSLSPDKIRDIFQQYPVVRYAYDENVPPLTESAFWSRFFLSKLCRKLRGEKIGHSDAPDTIMDKYLDLDVDGMTAEQREIENENAKVMRFVNVEANEMDDSQKAGNTPDFTMRQTTEKDTLSIIRTINKLSQRIVQSVEGEAQQPEEVQEQQKARELALNDLEPEAPASHIELHLHRSSGTEPALAASSGEHTKNDGLDAEALIETMTNSLPKGSIHQLLASNILSPSEASQAQSHVFALLQERRRVGQPQNKDADAGVPQGDAATVRNLRLSHTTAVEFLHHFWSNFLSGDASRAASALPILAASVDKSKVRLQAVIDAHVAAIQTVDSESASEERKRVNSYVKITLDALQLAVKTYNAELDKQTAAAASRSPTVG